MTKTGDQNQLIRRLDARDRFKLGTFFEDNNRKEVIRFFHPFPMIESTATELLNPVRRDLFFGMEENDRLIGFSMLRGWDGGFDIPSFGIVVDSDRQKKGLGHYLTEWTIRWADQIGCAKVRLTVYEDNEAAYKLFLDFGFAEISRSLQSNGLARLVMQRDYSPAHLPIYISTQCLPAGEPLLERLKRLYAAGLHHIELSNYPLTDSEDFHFWAKEFPGQLMLHHFFPPAQKNLVLNLASPNDELRSETLDFFMRGLDYSVVCNAKFYSIHAGYITDPVGRDEHGFVFHSKTAVKKSQALNRYVESLILLAQYAKERGVKLLVENNVVAEHHRGKLLLSTPSEFQEFYARWPENLQLGILLDWGHWQITARTFQEDLDGFAGLNERVMGLHLHSNNRLDDQHQPFEIETDTLKMVKAFNPAFVTLEGRYKGLSELQAATLKMEKILE